MWKIILALLAVTAGMLMARIVYDPPVIQTRVGVFEAPTFIEAPTLPPFETAYAFAGVRG